MINNIKDARMARFVQRRNHCLDRLRKLRQLNAPRMIIRAEQLILWAIRACSYHPEYEQISSLQNIPGWYDNFMKFVAIHDVQGRA